jgi:hypothetical protein
MCCDADQSLPIKICAGANVADRCVLLPGCTIHRNALLGSGGLAAKGANLPPGSKWVGSREGSAVLLEAGSDATAEAPTIRPYGRVHSRGGSVPYRVAPTWLHALWACATKALAVSYRALTLSLALACTVLFLGEQGIGPADIGFLDLATAMVPMYIAVQNW